MSILLLPLSSLCTSPVPPPFFALHPHSHTACSLSVSAGHVYCCLARLQPTAAPPHTETTGWNRRSALWRNAAEFQKIYNTHCLLLPRQETNTSVHVCQRSAIYPKMFLLLMWLVGQTAKAGLFDWMTGYNCLMDRQNLEQIFTFLQQEKSYWLIDILKPSWHFFIYLKLLDGI